MSDRMHSEQSDSQVREVWKFAVPIQSEFSHAMPIGSVPLWVAVQRGEPFMWVDVEPKAALTERRFGVVGTGHQFTDAPLYVGSFMLDGGAFVGHVYERSSS